MRGCTEVSDTSAHEQHVAAGARGYSLVHVPAQQAVEEAVLAAPDHDQIGVAFLREREQPFGGVSDFGYVLRLDRRPRQRHLRPLEVALSELLRLRPRLIGHRQRRWRSGHHGPRRDSHDRLDRGHGVRQPGRARDADHEQPCAQRPRELGPTPERPLGLLRAVVANDDSVHGFFRTRRHSFDACANWRSKKVYRWIEHTGELKLLIEGPTEEAIFGEALAAFAELVGDDGGPDSERREVELEGDERDVLLADWLNEFVYLADAEQFVPEHLSELELEDGRLRATVRGRRGEPRPLLKAVSLHSLEYERRPEAGWRAQLVLDV
jgi:SHS2 domain-containing protein